MSPKLQGCLLSDITGCTLSDGNTR